MLDFRNKRKVAEDFKAIDEEFFNTIEDRKNKSNEILFSTFKTSLVEKTKNMAEYIKHQVSLLREDINDLTRFMLKDKFEDNNTLSFNGKKYIIDDKTSLKISSDPYYHIKFELLKPLEEGNTIILWNDELRGSKGVIAVDKLMFSATMFLHEQYAFYGLMKDGKELNEGDIDKIMSLPVDEDLTHDICLTKAALYLLRYISIR